MPLMAALIGGLLCVGGEQAIKIYVHEHKPRFEIGQFAPWLGLDWRYSENSGSAFGLFQDLDRNLYLAVQVAAVAVVTAMFFYYRHNGSRLLKLALFGLCVGAASNQLDRLRYGIVVDFINVRWFGRDLTFNIADIWINIACASLVVEAIRDCWAGQDAEEKEKAE